ncbi:MAG: hypothetical protein JXR56_00175 [Candidatus Cloacimonetes bacterium]|nr:hypothetical protein [Candidatus Cloacimonadota bacterium]
MSNIIGRRIVAEVYGEKRTVRVKLIDNKLEVFDWDTDEPIIKFRVMNANPTNPIVVISSYDCDEKKEI